MAPLTPLRSEIARPSGRTAAAGRDRAGERGFTLMEVLVALFITSFSLLALAQVFALSVTQVGSSQADMLAREKAAEAIESVFTARDSRTITWALLRNAAGGGVFLDGPQSLRDVGPDGLVNTSDDGAIQTIVSPGADNQLGTADDQVQPLTQYQRTITITDVNPNLRQIQVTVNYVTSAGTRNYTVTALISSYA
jgi:prepilin-type N-terminal cleavage/methylation domain-containing protein